MKRRHNIPLIWSAVCSYINKQLKTPVNTHPIRLYLDLNVECIWYINQGRLYEIKDGEKYPKKLPDETLAKMEDHIGFVYIKDFPVKGNTHHWQTYDEFLVDIELEQKSVMP